MKKLLLIILCIVFCLTFVSCGDPVITDGDVSEAKQETGKTTFGLNESASFKNLKFTAVEFKESTGADFFAPEEGNVFVGVKFNVENISNEEQSVSTLLMFEGYADDVKCDYSLSAATVFSDGTLDGSIAAGKKLVGWYALEVPENWSTIELVIKPDLLSDKNVKFVYSK